MYHLSIIGGQHQITHTHAINIIQHKKSRSPFNFLYIDECINISFTLKGNVQFGPNMRGTCLVYGPSAYISNQDLADGQVRRSRQSLVNGPHREEHRDTINSQYTGCTPCIIYTTGCVQNSPNRCHG